MTKARDYLAEKGLAKAGARGRFSIPAITELNRAIREDGITFTDYPTKKTQTQAHAEPTTTTENRVSASAPQRLDKRRDETVFYGIDAGDGVSHSDLVIAFDTCAQCHRSTQYCTHEIPQLPEYLGGGDGLLEHPGGTDAV